jgi:hypothetical protein
MPPSHKELEDHLNTITNDMRQVLHYLHNDDRTGKKGLVQEMADFKLEFYALQDTVAEFIHEYKKKEAIREAKVGLIAALVGGGASLVVWIAKIFFIK